MHHLCAPHKGNDRITQCDSALPVYGKAPRRQVVCPLLFLEVATPENKSMPWTVSSIQKFASNVVLSRMQLTLHATRRTPRGTSRLVLAMSTWSVKARRPPSRRCGDERVYGHTTTPIDENEYTTPPVSTGMRCDQRSND